MQSSLKDHSLPSEQAEKIKQLLGCQHLQLHAKQGGGNSVVLCVEADGERWAIKSYPPYAPNQRDRLAAELMAYQFLNQHAVPAVPFVKTHCEKERWLVMSWIEGAVPQNYSADDVTQAIQFISSVANLNALPSALSLPQAAEACVSLSILFNQITQRFQRLQAVAEEDSILKDFLEQDFYPVFKDFQQRASAGYAEKSIDPDAELPLHQRSLIPADFGFHNTIRDTAGQLYFFDFDYFGWDDPVKLLADILWHPKMQLSVLQKEQFIQGLSMVYQADPLFLSRFYYTWPLFGLRWVLILLNEFIPAFWSNRQHADVYQDQEKAKKIQLKRAKDLLINVQQIGCPYEISR